MVKITKYISREIFWVGLIGLCGVSLVVISLSLRGVRTPDLATIDANCAHDTNTADVCHNDASKHASKSPLLARRTSPTGATVNGEHRNTLDAASLYPTGPGIIGNYSREWYLMSNTLAAKNGLFGAASRDESHWINQYQPGADNNNVSTLYVISPNGQYGITTAIRSSDNVSKSAQNIIGDNVSCIADSQSIAHRTWCRYEHGIISENAAVEGHINDENSILNLGLEVHSDPYNLNPSGQTSNLRLDSGVGNGKGKTVSSALAIISNSAKYYSGIQFGDGAFDASKTGGIGHAVQLPNNTALTWQHRAGLADVDWRLYSSTTKEESQFKIEGLGVVRVGATNSGNIGIQGGDSPKIFSTKGELMLGSATGKLTAPVIDTRAIVSTGSVVDITISGLGIYGGVAQGVYQFPTLQFSDSDSGATAFGRVNEMSVLSVPTIVALGTGYAVGDVITLIGGIFSVPAKLTVLAVDKEGSILNWERLNDHQLNDGYYTSAPISPVAVEGGSGHGASFTNLGWRPTQLSYQGGSGYLHPPKVTLHGNTSPYAGNVASTLTAKIDSSWSATAAAGAVSLDSSGTKLGIRSAPVIVVGDLKVGEATIFSGDGSISASGVDQRSATALIYDYNDVINVPRGAGVSLSPYRNGGARRQEVWNSGTNSLLVYPPIGAAIDKQAPNTAVILPPGSRAVFISFSPILIRQAY